MNKPFFSTIILLLLSLTGHCQITYGANLNLGVGQTIDHFSGGEDVNFKRLQNFKFCKEIAYKIGGDFGYRVPNTRILVGTGADLSYISSSFMYVQMPFDEGFLDDFDYPLFDLKIDNYRVLINIPFTIYHIYEEWFWIYAGITNKFGVINKLYQFGDEVKENNHNIEYNLGVDFIIKEKYKLGLNYNRDINMQFEYLGRMVKYDYYKWHQAYIKLGYIIK